jgi:RNA polymerase sigma-70 factor (ECF subfamily)
MEHLSDAELMELVKRGDFSAFDELYNRHSGPIRRFLFSLAWDQETAEDYLQEVFLRLYRAREHYEPTGRFSTYLFQIAKNYYIAQRRKNARRSEEVSLSEEYRGGFGPYENLCANERIEPEVHLLEEYRRRKIRQAISLLPEGQKLVFVMAHLEDMKYSEIAEVLKMPVGTVKSRMFAAVRTLKSLLQED